MSKSIFDPLCPHLFTDFYISHFNYIFVPKAILKKRLKEIKTFLFGLKRILLTYV